MEEIFLQDYANNVAQAQDPFGVAAVQAQPGFENYTPSFVNQDLTPMGLVDERPTRSLDLKNIGKNIIRNQATNYVIKQMGLEGLKGNLLSSVLGTNPYVQGIATLSSALTGNPLNISNFLAQKRAEKVYERSEKQREDALNKSTTQAIQTKLDQQAPSAQDKQRTEQYSTEASKKSSPARQERHSAGVGGLHSGY
jgi:hypothetical protein